MSRSHTVLPLQPLAYPLAQPERKHRRECRDDGTAKRIRLPVAADRIALPYLPIIALAHVHHLPRPVEVRILHLLQGNPFDY